MIWFLAADGLPGGDLRRRHRVYEPWTDCLRPGRYAVLNGLGLVQLGVSVIASIAVVVLTRQSFRWLAWAAILAIGTFTVVLHLGSDGDDWGLLVNRKLAVYKLLVSVVDNPGCARRRDRVWERPLRCLAGWKADRKRKPCQGYQAIGRC